MKFTFVPFLDFIQNHTTQNSRSRYLDSVIMEFDLRDGTILAKVKGTRIYQVQIKFNQDRVESAWCSCPYDFGGACKHIIHVLKYADDLLQGKIKEESVAPVHHIPQMMRQLQPLHLRRENNGFVIPDKRLLDLDILQLKPFLVAESERLIRGLFLGNIREVRKEFLCIEVIGNWGSDHFVEVRLEQRALNLHVNCTCSHAPDKLCMHICFLMEVILNGGKLRLPFDKDMLDRQMKEIAVQYGFGNLEEEQLLQYFRFEAGPGRDLILSPDFNLMSLSGEDLEVLRNKLLPVYPLPAMDRVARQEFLLVVKKQYGEGFSFDVMSAPLAKRGGIKSPLRPVSLEEKFNNTTDNRALLFYAAILREREGPDLIPEDKAVLSENPLHLPCYYFEPQRMDEKPTPSKIKEIQIKKLDPKLVVRVQKEKDFYLMSGEIEIEGKSYSLNKMGLSGNFYRMEGMLYFFSNEKKLNVIHFLKKSRNRIIITFPKFEEFKKIFLDHLEDEVEVDYNFIKMADKELVSELALNKISKKIIYLSETGGFILITPAVRYGKEKEVPLISERKIYYIDEKGKYFSVERNKEEEAVFLKNIQDLHPAFKEVPRRACFYLKRQEFLEDGWFLEAFEDWRKKGYEVLGFNKIKNNPYNTNKMKARMVVKSGIDWFDVETKVFFGEQQVRLRDLQKAVMNRSRFLKLGDGTMGLLPEEWIEKFSHYFRSGEIRKDKIEIHKSNFQLLDHLFQREVLSRAVRSEIDTYKGKLSEFQEIKTTKVPVRLKAKLRPYQKEGLNWLHFLAEFGFGGILADDMGLGKTVQIIAFILSLKERGQGDSNLIIVPKTLLFNWQDELSKFAPGLTYKILHGTNRKSDETGWENFDIILTTYGTLIADIDILRKKIFDVIALDESQAIKNPDSKRYKAVRLLKAKHRIAATGTPVENRTFDLFAQLSFVMPGLLGSQKKFKEDYAIPIDKFQDEERAKELQEKVHPFILRRTKRQVAKDLPEKTEIVIHCEMEPEQKKVYELYKEKFQKDILGMSEEEVRDSRFLILQGLTKLRQVCNSPALLSDEEYYGNQSSKLVELLQQINKLKEEHKMLVFSQFVGMLELIKERLEQENIKYAYLTGKTQKREQEVALFQNDEETRVFLISLKAGGTGLNLTEADYVFIVDPWWNPAVENQAIDRLYRIGQKNNVIAVRLIVPDSIEEKIMALQKKKLKLVEDLIHTDQNVLKTLTREDLLKLI